MEIDTSTVSSAESDRPTSHVFDELRWSLPEIQARGQPPWLSSDDPKLKETSRYSTTLRARLGPDRWAPADAAGRQRPSTRC